MPLHQFMPSASNAWQRHVTTAGILRLNYALNATNFLVHCKSAPIRRRKVGCGKQSKMHANSIQTARLRAA